MTIRGKRSFMLALYGGHIQQLCANWGSMFANGGLMAQLPAGLNCSGIMKTAIGNCNGNITCYSAPNALQNSSINSTTHNLTGGAGPVNNQSTMPNHALQSIQPQNPYLQQPNNNNHPYQSMPQTYPYSPYQQ